MANPKLRVRSSGYSGSGYALGARVGDEFREVKNADGELIKARVGADGKALVVPGVTTVLRMLDKPALIQWSVDLTVAWAADNWQYLGSHSDEQILRAGKYRHKDVLNERAEIGTRVHEFADVFMNDGFEYPDLDEESEQAVGQFLEFANSDRFGGALATELTVVNETLGYAGTFDLIGLVDGLVSLCDLKTSKGLWWEHELQLAALAHAEYMILEGEDGFWVHHPMPEFEALKLIQVRPNYWDPRTKTVIPAFYHVSDVEKDEWALHFRAFAGILESAKVKRELKLLRKDRPENF